MAIFQWVGHSSDITNLQAIAQHVLYETYCEGLSHGYSGEWLRKTPETHVHHATKHLLQYLHKREANPRLKIAQWLVTGFKRLTHRYTGPDEDHLHHSVLRLVMAIALEMRRTGKLQEG